MLLQGSPTRGSADVSTSDAGNIRHLQRSEFNCLRVRRS